MSYDISIEFPPCSECGHLERFEWDGLTYNLREMFVEAFQNGDGMRGLDGKKTEEVAPILERALADMEARPDHYRRFDSPNGWGTFDGSDEESSIVYLLRRFLRAARRAGGTVRVQ